MAYLLFLSSALPIINNFNKLMQRESHVLQQELNGLIRKLLLRLINPDYVCAAPSVVQVDIDNLPLEEVFVGDATMQYLESADEITSFEKAPGDMLVLVVYGST